MYDGPSGFLAPMKFRLPDLAAIATSNRTADLRFQCPLDKTDVSRSVAVVLPLSILSVGNCHLEGIDSALSSRLSFEAATART